MKPRDRVCDTGGVSPRWWRLPSSSIFLGAYPSLRAKTVCFLPIKTRGHVWVRGFGFQVRPFGYQAATKPPASDPSFVDDDCLRFQALPSPKMVNPLLLTSTDSTGLETHPNSHPASPSRFRSRRRPNIPSRATSLLQDRARAPRQEGHRLAGQLRPELDARRPVPGPWTLGPADGAGVPNQGGENLTSPQLGGRVGA